MPKREPTPPPPDSEPYYLTILNPYPPNASMAVAGDLQNLALWLAAVTELDTNALMAIFHKPSSPRLIILELDRNYRDIRRLLGQHFWGGPKGFLNNPGPPENDNYSAIFFCHYTTARNVEKHGWKRAWFYDYHFHGQKGAIDTIFKHPYPATTYLQVPATDPTALEFCRHLPLDLFPEVGSNKTKPSEAPVGSKIWATKKEQGPPMASQTQSSTASVSGVTAALSTLNVAQKPQDPQEPQDLWAASTQAENGETVWMSDLAIASLQGESELDQGVCPFHGLLCKKMCAWRTDYDKKRGPKSEGPSNIKNYNRAWRGGKNGRGRPTVNTARSSENQSPPESTNMSPVATSPTTAGRGASTIKRAPPPPPGLVRSVVVSPVKQTASETVPTVAPAVAGRGVPNGPVRGAPAWSSRGRGRGRAV